MSDCRWPIDSEEKRSPVGVPSSIVNRQSDMTRRSPHARGQSMLEYLVVISAVVAALATLSLASGCRVLALMTTAVNQVP